MTADEWLTCPDPARMIAALVRLPAADRPEWDDPFLSALAGLLAELSAEPVFGNWPTALLTVRVAFGRRRAGPVPAAPYVPPRTWRDLLFGPRPPVAVSDPAHPWHARFQEGAAEADLVMADLLRCVAGNPFRPAPFAPRWRTAAVVGLAEAVHADRGFDRMPILADALEGAGCDDPVTLDHCRGASRHARGCWVVQRCRAA